MKTLFLIISITIFTSNSLFAQWSVTYSDTNSAFEKVYFTDANTGYTVGRKDIGAVYFPRIYKTTNAGISWIEQTSSPERDSAGFVIGDVFFTDMNTGFIAVVYPPNYMVGRILKTTTGGNNWFIVPLPVNRNMSNIFFISPSTGYTSGQATVLKTTDAGATWLNVSPGFSQYLFGIHFTDVNTGYVVGNNGAIFKTTTGGTNWVQQNPTSIHLWGVSFADANTGVAVGGNFPLNTINIILRTTNAGLNWDTISYTYSPCYLFSVRFINPTTGWITGACSQIIKTTNGGLNWFNQAPPVNVNSSHFRGSFFTSALTGYISGGISPLSGAVGYIVKTTDGGGPPIGIEPITNEVPMQFSLSQNYPNPFNPTTKIRFSIPLLRGVDAEGGRGVLTSIKVYDILGREVAALVNEHLSPGTYEVEWDASNYPSGVYYYRLQTDGFTETKKMILLK